MNIHKLSNFPEIRIEQNQGMHCMFLDGEATMLDRYELHAMANGANLLSQVIQQYLNDMDYMSEETK